MDVTFLLNAVRLYFSHYMIIQFYLVSSVVVSFFYLVLLSAVRLCVLLYIYVQSYLVSSVVYLSAT